MIHHWRGRRRSLLPASVARGGVGEIINCTLCNKQLPQPKIIHKVRLLVFDDAEV